MSDFDAIDSLLAAVGPEAELPAARVRQELRERARLSKAQVARALGVGPSTVAGWEGGRDPVGEIRTKYAYLLDGLAAKFAADTEPDTAPTTEPVTPSADSFSPEPAEGDEVETLAVPEPCVMCGHPAGTRVAGFAQHLDAADCRPTATVAAPPAEPAARPANAQAPRRPSEGSKGPARRAFQEPSGPGDLIGHAVKAVLAEHQGDVEAATAALLKRAIPDAMRLLDESRKGARYDVIAHPWIPDILRKQTSRGADQIWEARPKWTRAELPPGRHEVTALDINGAYLSALKTHLPLGQLEHSTGLAHDRRRAGVHLITPPEWEHEAVLPNPVGNRDEPGPLWVTEPTLRLLLRVSGPRYGLCAPPEIHESYTSGATENLLEKFRIALKDARDTAIAAGDEVTLEYVKAMYSKFVSTMGESNYNRELYRPDWMHIIRSQAFANLWLKALKAHDEGLTVVRAMGTDELHVIGDWRRVFPEGRGVTEVKVKDTYTAGTGTTEHTETEGEE
ncbi:helix-turn-helix transcriptional regulator [Streptomyces olivoreticuli]|uniref:helix-turn-helix domain-containing protein n=1 Tax=Streptomyces olivoreticuli TaxID=68246 RepID=UPI00265863A9|nr:helix-turn-helix transcriptional regulator [Streptomyces olivoreticuli]WKK24413.1 helix-turn-helix transcriptional regulator [Streptomyces olivoreticuli]